MVATRDTIFYLKRKNIHHSVVTNNKGREKQEGWLINHYRLSLNPKNSQAIKESYQYVIDNKLSIPTNYIQIYHRFTGNKNSKYLEYSYFANPESAGFEPPLHSEWVASEWNPLKINNDSKKVDYIEKLKKEGGTMHKKLKIAFEN